LQRLLSLADRERIRFTLALALAAVLCLALLARSVGWLTNREPAPQVPKPMEMQLVELAPLVPSPVLRPAAPPSPIMPATHAATPATVKLMPREAQLAHAAAPLRAPAPQPHEEARAPMPEPVARDQPVTSSTQAQAPAAVSVAQAASATSASSGSVNSTAPSPPSGSTQARLLSQPVPVLPDDLREQGYQVTAIAHFKVHPDGTFDVELVKPTQNPRLNQILLETLHRWRFFPAMENGHPVESDQDVRVHFSVS
jgi:protein TonB